MPQKILSFWRRWEWPSFGRSAATSGLAEPSEEDILAALLSEPPGCERRTSIRHYIDKPIVCQAVALVTGEPWPAVLRDISATGAGLVLQEPVEPGSFLRVEVPRPSGTGHTPIQVRVVANRPQTDGSWLVGCLLVRPLLPEEVESLV